MRHPIRFALATLLFALAVCSTASSLTAQSAITASVSGTVRDETGRMLARVVVTLRAVGAGADQETATDHTGAYAFPLAAPGTYEIRAEAIGFRPVVARTLELSGGDALDVPLTLGAATPPVVTVDTVALQGSTTTRLRPGGVRLDDGDINELPHRFEDLSSVVGLSTHFGPSLGSQGLPGSMTVLFADGLPVYRARHPLLREEDLANALFPRAFLAGVTALHNAPDIEWAGGAGGYANVSTLSSVSGGVEIDGAWSGAPLWASDELDLTETPGLTSYQASGRAAVDLKPDTTQLLLASEVLRHEAPRAPRLTQSMADALDGLDPGLLAALGSASVERVSRYSGLGRFYTQPSATSRLFFRGAVAHTERSFEGMGAQPTSHTNGPGGTSTDFSIASSFVSEFQPGLTLEFRGGVSGSSRVFEPTLEGLPSAYLVGSGIPLGEMPGGAAESSRTDAVFTPLARIDLEERGMLKLGLSGRASRFTMEAATWGAGDFLFSDPAALIEGRGFARTESLGTSTFTTREVGAFVGYDLTPAAGLDVSLGARFDVEMIPSEEPTLSTAWSGVALIRNDLYPSSFQQLGGRAAVSWDPSNDGRTRLYAVGTVQSGDVDPGHLFEVFGRDAGTDETSFAGGGVDWPEGTIPAGASELLTLGLFGPDTRPPRSFLGTVGVFKAIGAGLSVHVSGDFRRTDFLMRRRNLNLPEAPSARDASGRDVYGTLSKDGSMVTATGSDIRRFLRFGSVWALDPDGWSEHRALSAGLDYRSDLLDLHGSVTRSETIDNWIGASQGSPDAELSPRLPALVEGWDEARSDFDVPTRATASAVLRVPALPGTSLSATWRYSSGRPFTPGYRRGVDANGDGSFENDVPFVPQPEALGALYEEWKCLRDQAGGFAIRNSCRGPARQEIDVRLRVGLGRVVGQQATLFVDALDLIESEDGLIDRALLLVDPDAPLVTEAGGTQVTVPLEINQGFGSVLLPTSRGRMLRIGMRIGG